MDAVAPTPRYNSTPRSSNPVLAAIGDDVASSNQFVFKWEIPLSPAEIRALDLVEGENEEYSPNQRVMTQLDAFCHACDTMSARIWFDFGISRVKSK